MLDPLDSRVRTEQMVILPAILEVRLLRTERLLGWGRRGETRMSRLLTTVQRLLENLQQLAVQEKLLGPTEQLASRWKSATSSPCLQVLREESCQHHWGSDWRGRVRRRCPTSGCSSCLRRGSDCCLPGKLEQLVMSRLPGSLASVRLLVRWLLGSGRRVGTLLVLAAVVRLLTRMAKLVGRIEATVAALLPLPAQLDLPEQQEELSLAAGQHCWQQQQQELPSPERTGQPLTRLPDLSVLQ